MRQVCVLVFSIVVFTARAQQFPSDLWHEGKVVLESGDTLRGNIKYDMQSDILQFEKANKLESFSARKVVFFEIFDRTVKRYRQFYSLPYASAGGYKAPVFFELLSEGKLTLLCRESLEYRTYSNTFYNYYTSSRLVLINKFFILTDNGSIETFSGKRSDLEDKMGNQAETVDKFIKDNRLKLDRKYDLAQIVEYYNSLK